VPDRFGEIVDSLTRENQEKLDREIRRAEWQRKEEIFFRNWSEPYRDLAPTDDGAFALAAKRLMGLREEIQNRFWDFRIAEFLSRKIDIWAYELSLLILQKVCRGTENEVSSDLKRSAALLQSIASVHWDLFDTLKARDAQGLPFTPPLSQVDLAKVAGITLDAVRGQKKAGHWQHQPAIKYQRLRMWRHKDPDIQARTLTKIRDEFPEKMWSAHGR
jgi:hypothetical protein